MAPAAGRRIPAQRALLLVITLQLEHGPATAAAAARIQANAPPGSAARRPTHARRAQLLLITLQLEHGPATAVAAARIQANAPWRSPASAAVPAWRIPALRA